MERMILTAKKDYFRYFTKGQQYELVLVHVFSKSLVNGVIISEDWVTPIARGNTGRWLQDLDNLFEVNFPI